MSDIGKIIWNRDRTEKGIVTNISSRYCACCGQHECLIVKWDDGTKTKPCTKGIKSINTNELQIE
jgi:hypothetical protein